MSKYLVVITPTGDRFLSWKVRCLERGATDDWWTTITHRGAVRSARRWVAAKTRRDQRMQRPPEVIA